MEALSELIGITGPELTRLIYLGVILLILLIVGRMALKLTATLFRVGCFTIFLIVGAVYLISLMSGN
jgi:hypothetical protein